LAAIPVGITQYVKARDARAAFIGRFLGCGSASASQCRYWFMKWGITWISNGAGCPWRCLYFCRALEPM
jgi:hypothetical protein